MSALSHSLTDIVKHGRRVIRLRRGAVQLQSFLLASALIFPALANAQDENDPAEACQEAIVLLEENDIEGALEEARWCVEGIEQIKQQQTLAFFPDEVDGFTGGEISSQSVMGMKMIERDYMREGGSINVSLTGGGAAAAGLAALAKLGMDLGGDAGVGKKMRVQRRTVYDNSDGNSAEFMVNLRSGSMLNISSNSVSRDDTLSFIKAFPIKELDNALKNDQ